MTKRTIENFILPLVLVFVAFSGNMLMRSGQAWYSTLSLPTWAADPMVQSYAWILGFICLGMSLFTLAKIPAAKSPRDMSLLRLLFVLNLSASLLGAFLFFGIHDLVLSIWNAAVIGFATCALILMVKPISHKASLYLFPYAIWMTYITYLLYSIWLLNRY